MDHSRPTYERDGRLDTLGEKLTWRYRGTKVYPSGTVFGSDVPPQDIGSTILAYESRAIESFMFYDGHDGHDFAVSGDALAAAAGTVMFANNSGTPLGRMVEIYHPEGYLTRYAHLADFAAGIAEGQTVEVGQAVGTIGGSRVLRGELVDHPDPRAWGIHLHFSVFRWNAEREEWQVTDPFGWDPWKSPGGQGDDPLIACNGEISYNLWFGWRPQPYGGVSNVAILEGRPAFDRYLGGSLADEDTEWADTPASTPEVTSYTVTDLGTLPGTTSSLVQDINASGTAVGYTVTEGVPGTEQGFVWGDGTITGLGRWRASAINDAGQIVGTSTGFESPTHPILWEMGQETELAVIPGSFQFSATDINDGGQVVGRGSFATIQEPHLPWYAFLYDNGIMVDLGTLGGRNAEARGINDAGWIVGFAETAAEEKHAALWRDGAIIDLGVLPGDTVSQANAINNDGLIIGESWVSGDPFPRVRGFLWSEEGGMVDIGGLPDAYQTRPTGINSAGDIVGASGFRGDSVGVEDGMRAFLFRNGSMANLNDLITSETGWVLTAAQAINDLGQIVGSGTLTGTVIPYEGRAVLLTPTDARQDVDRDELDTAPPPQFSPAGSPEEAAAAAIQALVSDDLGALARLYDPGTAPATWADVWPGYPDNAPNFSGCNAAEFSNGSAWTDGACQPGEYSTAVTVLRFAPLAGCGELVAGQGAPGIHSVSVDTLKMSSGWVLVGPIRLNGNPPEFGPPCIDGPDTNVPESETMLPSEFTGVWEGTGTQTNPTAEWPIAITITSGPVNSVIGTVNYPSLGCVGNLTLYRVVGDPPFSSIEVGETITSGADICVNGGTFKLLVGESGFLEFEWTSPDGQMFAEGALSGRGASVLEPSREFSFAAQDWVGGLYQGNGEWYGRPWVAVYGAYSEYPTAVLQFSLDAPPAGDGTLYLSGLDDEFAANATIEVSVNGVLIYSGPSPFQNWDGNMANQGVDAAWIQATITIPSGLLVSGVNEVSVANLEPTDAVGAPPWVLLGDAVVETG